MAMTPNTPFCVSLTADFFDASGQMKYHDIGLDRIDCNRRFSVGRFDDHHPEISPEQLSGVNGVVVLTPRVTTHSLSQSSELLVIARFGVGFDSVDVPACTAQDVVLCIATGAVDRPVAEATVGWMLALTHHLRTKDRLVRESRWGERSVFMGCELRERTLGVIGFGGIGRSLVKLLSNFAMNPPLVYDPFMTPSTVQEHGATSVSLDELLTRADFVSIHCPLSEQTRNLIGDRELSMMKSTSYLINTARGGIVDESALAKALASQSIAGAALDCFVDEPLTSPTIFAQFENVLLAPHCIAWTNEMFRDTGRTAFQSIIDLAAGITPKGVVNPEVLSRPGFLQKWNRLQHQSP